MFYPDDGRWLIARETGTEHYGVGHGDGMPARPAEPDGNPVQEGG